jgi:hypothetical protein
MGRAKASVGGTYGGQRWVNGGAWQPCLPSRYAKPACSGCRSHVLRSITAVQNSYPTISGRAEGASGAGRCCALAQWDATSENQCSARDGRERREGRCPRLILEGRQPPEGPQRDQRPAWRPLADGIAHLLGRRCSRRRLHSCMPRRPLHTGHGAVICWPVDRVARWRPSTLILSGFRQLPPPHQAQSSLRTGSRGAAHTGHDVHRNQSRA